MFPPSHSMVSYNYCGSVRWSARERQQFRRAWRVHRKQFHLLKSTVSVRTCGVSVYVCGVSVRTCGVSVYVCGVSVWVCVE